MPESIVLMIVHILHPFPLLNTQYSFCHFFTASDSTKLFFWKMSVFQWETMETNVPQTLTLKRPVPFKSLSMVDWLRPTPPPYLERSTHFGTDGQTTLCHSFLHFFISLTGKTQGAHPFPFTHSKKLVSPSRVSLDSIL